MLYFFFHSVTEECKGNNQEVLLVLLHHVTLKYHALHYSLEHEVHFSFYLVKLMGKDYL